MQREVFLFRNVDQIAFEGHTLSETDIRYRQSEQFRKTGICQECALRVPVRIGHPVEKSFRLLAFQQIGGGIIYGKVGDFPEFFQKEAAVLLWGRNELIRQIFRING